MQKPRRSDLFKHVGERNRTDTGRPYGAWVLLCNFYYKQAAPTGLSAEAIAQKL
jgi:hypothetical protein